MSPENTAKLAAICPKGFHHLGGDPRETCMAWGVDCGDGWFGILERMCQRIQEQMQKDPEHMQTFAFDQIKEKFGTLRVYFHGGNKMADEFVGQAERESETTCEACGSTEGIGRTSGYIQTLCKNCGEGIRGWEPRKDDDDE